MNFVFSPYFKVLAALVVIAAIAGGAVFMHFYNDYAAVIDRRLSGEIFQLNGPSVAPSAGQASTRLSGTSPSRLVENRKNSLAHRLACCSP